MTLTAGAGASAPAASRRLTGWGWGGVEHHGRPQAKNSDHFRDFVTENYDSYIARKRHERCYGNHLELQAMSELYNRNIEVYAYGLGER